MNSASTGPYKGAALSGLIALAIGEGITWIIGFASNAPTETRVWAMHAVGWASFFAGFFSYLGGRKDEAKQPASPE